jgi:ketosteroid isomerase-like protein
MNSNLEANKTTVRQFLEAMGSRDANRAFSFLTEDVVLVTMGTSVISATRNHDEVNALFQGLSKALKTDVQWKFISYTAEEDRVSCEAESSATLFNGQPYANQYHFLFYLREGKIFKLKEYLDTKYTDSTLAVALGELQAQASS